MGETRGGGQAEVRSGEVGAATRGETQGGWGKRGDLWGAGSGGDPGRQGAGREGDPERGGWQRGDPGGWRSGRGEDLGRRGAGRGGDGVGGRQRGKHCRVDGVKVGGKP